MYAPFHPTPNAQQTRSDPVPRVCVGCTCLSTLCTDRLRACNSRCGAHAGCPLSRIRLLVALKDQECSAFAGLPKALALQVWPHPFLVNSCRSPLSSPLAVCECVYSKPLLPFPFSWPSPVCFCASAHLCLLLSALVGFRGVRVLCGESQTTAVGGNKPCCAMTVTAGGAAAEKGWYNGTHILLHR